MSKTKLETRPRRRSFRFWTWAHRLSAAGFLTLLVLGHQTWFPWFKGSPTGTSLLGAIPFVDPLAALEVSLASGQATTTMLTGVGILVLIALLLGRVFCGWLCPLGLLLELNDTVRTWLDRRLHRIGRRLPDFQLPKELKYWLLLALLVMALIAAMPIFTTFSPINLMVLAIVTTPGWELAILGAILALEYASPRAFCRAICPLGALYSLLGRFGIWRVRIQPETGKSLFCQLCTKECPMGIEVLEQHVNLGKQTVDDPECTRCGTCTDGCLGHMLHLGFNGLSKRTASTEATDQPCC